MINNFMDSPNQYNNYGLNEMDDMYGDNIIITDTDISAHDDHPGDLFNRPSSFTNYER